MRTQTLFLAAFVVLAVLSSAKAPNLPYKHYASWTVITTTTVVGNNTKLIDSYGMHAAVDSVENVLCIYERQKLLPNVPEYHRDEKWNFTAGTFSGRVVYDSGKAGNCTSGTVNETMPYGGASYLAPSQDILARLTFLEYTLIGTLNCSVYQLVTTSPDNTQEILTWTVATGTLVPQTYVNETLQADGKTRLVQTTAFNGYHEQTLPGRCMVDFTCGEAVCVAKPQASPSALQAAISWVCGEEDCSAINPGGANYYPNTIVAHTTWAFGQYYSLNKAVDGDSACVFSGLAEIVICNDMPTRCNATAKANPEKLDNALAWICSSKGIQDCSPIQQGGSNFYPNTTQSHADWAFNVYYQAYKCIPDFDSCDFGGVAEVVSG